MMADPTLNDLTEAEIEAIVKAALSVATYGTIGNVQWQIAYNAVKATVTAMRAAAPANDGEVERLVNAANRVLAAMDDYNEKNGTALGGPAFFELGRAIAALATSKR